jgi:hypothetical protein
MREGNFMPDLPPDNDDNFKNDLRNPAAVKICPNQNPLIRFADHDWWINYHWSKATGSYVWGGKDPNEPVFGTIFDPRIIETGPDFVRLWTRQPDPNRFPPPPGGTAVWRTSEIVLVDKMKYGHYLVTARADNGSFSDFDPQTVFGLFSYQNSTAPSGMNIHREIDLLEVLRGGGSNAQFTLQPWDYNPHPWDPFTIPPNTPVVTAVLRWVEEGGQPSAYFHLFLGDYTLANHPPWNNAFRNWNGGNFPSLVPRWTPTSCVRFHMNLWLMHGKTPSSGREQSVTITRFQIGV